MELLSPTHTPLPAADRFSGFLPPAGFRQGFDRSSPTATSQPPEIVEEGGDRIHVAVGKSVVKANALLRWSFERFRNREICILHVHQPSPFIPTLRNSLSLSLSRIIGVFDFVGIVWLLEK